MEDLIGIVNNIISSINNAAVANYGATTDSNFQVKLNEIDEEAGIGAKVQVLLAGPTLDKLKENGSVLYPDKSDDDMFTFISIKVKGSPQEAIDTIQGLIAAFGIPLEMLDQFGELKFHAGDGEILIGFKAGETPYAAMAKQFTIGSQVFGDGSQDISVDLSFNLGTTFSDMLDDTPVLEHLLKGMSIHGKSHVHEKTRETLVNVLAEKKDVLEPIISTVPFLMPLLLFKRVDGVLELQVTDEMKEQIKNKVSEVAAPALMSLKEAFAMGKAAGLPLEMIQPILELVQNIFGGEVDINIFASSGYRIIFRLPGLDQAIGEFLAA
mmetsp:Transcript_41347/g.47670  ORF Transcript_41347/g.47670 Transcript_41347/m.47670 type:complete len:324 (-) Transcript_41347:46-1017(-)|eukprot:CAMPEP_0168330290 /NCGR_PEP_ID=MMETSP0213-20121227/7633_1 /TAXON_ID=151035 /ORGANISM="Euplotes harpa, Strain FSP1.4" /LENGTH=323 /DNA_ID=CAMNT_0008333813 /DNA_START=28 /DNA_END=999 /DNA_ORIENTATION=-